MHQNEKTSPNVWCHQFSYTIARYESFEFGESTFSSVTKLKHNDKQTSFEYGDKKGKKQEKKTNLWILRKLCSGVNDCIYHVPPIGESSAFTILAAI